MSYLSPLPHQLSAVSRPRSHGLKRSLSEPLLVDLEASPVMRRTFGPRMALRDPERSRYYAMASRSQAIRAQDSIKSVHLARASVGTKWTVRSYSTQRLGFVRPQTTNRFAYHNHYPTNEWTERLSSLLTASGRVARSMSRWDNLDPVTRYWLTPMVPTYAYLYSTRPGPFIRR
jgi:hypothetical protein